MSNHLLNALRDEARENLHLTKVEVVGQIGPDINVGERFTLRLTIRNTFVGGDGEHPGHAHFTDVKVRVASTAFAVPADGDPVTYDLVAHLGFGNSVTKDVAFRATAKRNNLTVPIFNSKGMVIGTKIVDPIETVAKITILGKFDVVKFFEIAQDEVAPAQVS